MEGTTMDTFFITHGRRAIAMDEANETHKFLVSWADKVFERKPKAILIISGHWDTDEPSVTSADHHECFFKKPNLNPLLYKVKYKARGSPALATRVSEQLRKGGFDGVHLDETRVMDHGAWSPLKMMYPKGEIPVCQLSIQNKESATHHLNVGRALAPLLEEGVLIIGSGSATHNVDSLDQHYDSTPTWAVEFDRWLVDALLNGRYEDVKEYKEKAPYAKEAHPMPDHLYPLHVAMGAALEASKTPKDLKTQLIHHNWYSTTMSCACFRFTPNRFN